MIIKICEICKQEFQIFQCRANTARFCSYACMGASNIGKIPPTYIDLPIEDITQAYQDGATQTELAQQYNVSITTISDRLNKAGVEKRKPTGMNLRKEEVRQKSIANRRRGKDHPNYIELPIDEIVEAYKSGESLATIGKRYNVSPTPIKHRLVQNGIKLRRPGYTRTCKCSDGHIVSSKLEQAIDEWLTNHNLTHEVHPACPWNATWPSNPRADFLVGSAYIEVWGIEGSTRYDTRRLEKVALYKSVNADLIQIFPHHISDNDYSPLMRLIK